MRAEYLITQHRPHYQPGRPAQSGGGDNRHHGDLLRQVAEIEFAPSSDAETQATWENPPSSVSVEKQPGIDTVVLTREIEQSLKEMAGSLQAGMKADQILFRQGQLHRERPFTISRWCCSRR